MARIRTIKPELWTDPDFIECSLSARLLLIALLNFASDYGVLPDKPKQLKMQCLPADPVDIEPLIEELIASRFIVRRIAPDGSNVLVIRTFSQHQKVNRPSGGRWGNPAEWDNPPPPDPVDSLTPHGELSESSLTEGKGRELEGKGTGREGNIPVVVSNNSESVIHRQDDDDFHAVVELVVDAKLVGRTMKRPNGYRRTTTANTITEDGPRIRHLLGQMYPVELVADTVLSGDDDPLATPCPPPRHDPACPLCEGYGWRPDAVDEHDEPAPGARSIRCDCTEPDCTPASVTDITTRSRTA